MDILDFAIDMEKDGEKYYKEQAALHQQDGLKAVFDLLASEESGHAALLQSKKAGAPSKLNKAERPDLKNIFIGVAGLKSDTKKTPDQVDAYRMALEKEKQSIELYKKMLLQDGGEAELYGFLISQEEEHYEILEELIKIVNRPNDWVEAAEFGIREEY
jgi:rubrerythrin